MERMENEIASKQDFKTYKLSFEGKLLEKRHLGGPGLRWESPDMKGASGWSGLIGCQARFHGSMAYALYGVLCLIYFSVATMLKF